MSNQKWVFAELNWKFQISAEKVEEKTIKEGVLETATPSAACNISKIVGKTPSSTWSHHGSYLFFKNKANLRQEKEPAQIFRNFIIDGLRAPVYRLRLAF